MLNPDFLKKKKKISFKGCPINILPGTCIRCQIFIRIIFKLRGNMGTTVNEGQDCSGLSSLTPPSPGIVCSDLDLWFSFEYTD